MARYVWLSDIISDSRIGQKQGLRVKRFGAEWEPASEIPPPVTDELARIARKGLAGLPFLPKEMAEGLAIFNQSNFRKTKDLFTAGGPYAVKGKLAEVLGQFDLAPGGLYPLPIYQADLVTPVEGPFYTWNFGAQKQCFLPEQSNREVFKKRYVDSNSGLQVWEICSDIKDDEIAVSSRACEGADVWFDPTVENRIFMSDALVSALRAAKVKVDFRLARCRVIESEG